MEIPVLREWCQAQTPTRRNEAMRSKKEQAAGVSNGIAEAWNRTPYFLYPTGSPEDNNFFSGKKYIAGIRMKMKNDAYMDT